MPRGRPRKNAVVDEFVDAPVATPESSEAPKDEFTDTPTPVAEPKKRGRPAKAKVADSGEPKKRGRPAKAKTADSEEPKKRGRKPASDKAAKVAEKKNAKALKWLLKAVKVLEG